MPKTTTISLTESARSHIQSFLRDQPETFGFRIKVKETGCSGFSYIVDITEPQPTDFHLTVDGIPIYVEKDSAAIVDRTIVDFVAKGSGQKQLVFNNPNAGDLCGCGESFTLKKGDE